MRIFSLLPVLAALATAVAGASLPRRNDCGLEMGCDLIQSTTKRDVSGEHAARTIPGLTNAELLRRGLPLKNPVMRRGTPVRRTNPSDTPNPTKKHRGYVRVRRLGDNSVLGYVSANSFGQQQHRYQGIESAMIVNFETDSSGSGTQLNLIPENSDMPFGFLGMVQGRDDVTSDFAIGSYQYAYLAGTNETPPGSVPALVGNSYPAATPRTSESAVWTYYAADNSLSPNWVNSDGTLPTIEYFTQSTAIYMGGDSAAFNARYPAPIIPITFDFVSI